LRFGRGGGDRTIKPTAKRKLFIPRSDKNYKNDGNVEVRYTAGTWDTSLALWNSAVFLLTSSGYIGFTGSFI
jgi:hypothetical protein